MGMGIILSLLLFCLLGLFPKKYRSSSTPWIGIAIVLVVFSAAINALSDGEHEDIVYNITGSLIFGVDLHSISHRIPPIVPPITAEKMPPTVVGAQIANEAAVPMVIWVLLIIVFFSSIVQLTSFN